MGTPTVYVICNSNCKFEGMTKEQILTAIAQAVESGKISDVDTGFITTIKTIKGQPLKFFVGERSEYEALTEDEKKNLFAIITNDTTKESLMNIVEEMQDILDGKSAVPKATNATSLTRTENILDYDGNWIEKVPIERGKTYIFSVYFRWGDKTEDDYLSFILSIPKTNQTPAGYTSHYYATCNIMTRVISSGGTTAIKPVCYRLVVDIFSGGSARLMFHEMIIGENASGVQYSGKAKIIYHEIDSISD